ncbi:unnamed protein product [Trichobilharzia regenti]|nr:unnamed protein product [Trichobilharzia regenti]
MLLGNEVATLCCGRKCKARIDNDSSDSDNNNNNDKDINNNHNNNNSNINDDVHVKHAQDNANNKESKSSVVIPYKEGA